MEILSIGYKLGCQLHSSGDDNTSLEQRGIGRKLDFSTSQKVNNKVFTYTNTSLRAEKIVD